MAAEVDKQAYLFAPQMTMERRVTLLRRSREPAAQHRFVLPPYSMEYPGFFYNPIHDLESLWWIAVYFVLENEIPPVDALLARSADFWSPNAQLDYAHFLFEDGSYDRPNAIRKRDWFLKRTKEVVHRDIKPIVVELEGLRCKLVDAYHEAEEHIDTMDHNCAAALYSHFHNVFSGIATANDTQNLFLQECKYRPMAWVERRHAAQPKHPYNLRPRAKLQGSL